MKGTLTPAGLLRRLLDADQDRTTVSLGLLLLRVAVGALIFYVHGWHKLAGGWQHVAHGAPWPLLEEVAAMGTPLPLAAAFAATLVQFLAAPLLAIGLCTRVNAALLTAVLLGAVAQNLQSARDPQLAVLYTLAVAAFMLIGGGRYSWDARLSRRITPAHA